MRAVREPAKSGKNWTFLCFLLALIFAQAFFLFRQSDIAADLSIHQECQHQLGFAPPFPSASGGKRKGSGLSIGQRIVDQAYQDTYFHLVNHTCPEDKPYRKCLEMFYDRRVRKNITTGRWWFDTLMRDAVRFISSHFGHRLMDDTDEFPFNSGQ